VLIAITAAAMVLGAIIGLVITIFRLPNDPTKATGVGLLFTVALFSPVFWLITLGTGAIAYALLRR